MSRVLAQDIGRKLKLDEEQTMRTWPRGMALFDQRSQERSCRKSLRSFGFYSSSIPIGYHCAVIGLVSLYDMYLTVLYASSLKYMERNPLGRWLMRLDDLPSGVIPDLTLFLSAKSMGTFLVLLIVTTLYCRRRRIGQPVALGVSLFQILLAGYLTLGTV
jgi:hypothetical protein